jgi:hypothetical protein
MPSTINASTTSGIIQTADSSGVLGLQAGNATIATISGTGVAVTGNISATGTVAGSTGTVYPLVSGTTQATTSGTSIDFTSIPSWVKRITYMLNGVSTSGASAVIMQIGSGSVTTTGYAAAGTGFATSTLNTSNQTNGFYVDAAGVQSAASVRNGCLVFTTLGSNVWVCSGLIGYSNAANTIISTGSLTLSGDLDRVRLTTAAGTDTFDAGSVNILYE